MQTARSHSPRGRRGAAAGLLATSLAATVLLAGAASAATLDRVRDSSTLKLGYRQDAKPFSYDEGGKPAGYSVALCLKIADAVKEKLQLADLKIEYVPVTVEDRLDAVRDGKVDLDCGATTVTLSRREEVEFSIPTFPNGMGALLRSDAPTRLRNILAGKPQPQQPRWRASLGEILRKRTFEVRTGTTAQDWVNKKLDEFDIAAEIVPVAEYNIGVQDVVDRRADALFGDRQLLLQAAASSPAAGDLVVVSNQFTYEPIALAMQRNDDDFRLLVDRTLSKLYSSGAVMEIYKTYFGEPTDDTTHFFGMSALPE